MTKPSPDLDEDSTAARKRRSLRLVTLEADLAYFQARLELLGEPRSANQWAQRRTYELLRKSLGELILKTKRRIADSRADPK